MVVRKKVRSAEHGGAFPGQKRQSVGPRMQGSKSRHCLPCDGAPAPSNHPPQHVLNGSQSPRDGRRPERTCLSTWRPLERQKGRREDPRRRARLPGRSRGGQ